MTPYPIPGCPRCQAVLLGAAAGLMVGKCPFCLPRPNATGSGNGA